MKRNTFSGSLDTAAKDFADRRVLSAVLREALTDRVSGLSRSMSGFRSMTEVRLRQRTRVEVDNGRSAQRTVRKMADKLILMPSVRLESGGDHGRR